MGNWWSSLKGHTLSSINVRGANNNVVLIHGSVHDDWTAAFRRLENVIRQENHRLRLTIVASGLIVATLLAILLVCVVVVVRCWTTTRQRQRQRADFCLVTKYIIPTVAATVQPIELNSS